MAGYNAILELRRLESDLDQIGLMLTAPKHGWGSDIGDRAGVKPKDAESLPIYNRDAEVMVGTLNEIRIWLNGIQWARKYDQMLFGQKHDKNRERKEQDERNRQLVSIITKGEKE